MRISAVPQVLLVVLLALKLRDLLASPSSSPSAQLQTTGILTLYRVDGALDAVGTSSARKEIAKSCLRARSFNDAHLFVSAMDRPCLQLLAEICDLKLTASDASGGVTLSCKQNFGEAFSIRNWAIDLLLEDVVKTPDGAQQDKQQKESSTKQRIPDERTLIMGEFTANSKKNEPLKTKAARLWELYQARYRGTRLIRIRLYHSPASGSIKEFSVPSLTTASELCSPDRCGPVDMVYMRGNTISGNNNVKVPSLMCPISLKNNSMTLVELGLHPCGNLYYNV